MRIVAGQFRFMHQRRRRGELIERSFAHAYETGGLQRTHLRGHRNILKRLLIHIAGFNLGVLFRHLIGVGTPRSLQGRRVAALLHEDPAGVRRFGLNRTGFPGGHIP